jgi:hypothetical protein
MREMEIVKRKKESVRHSTSIDNMQECLTSGPWCQNQGETLWILEACNFVNKVVNIWII